MTQSHSRTWEIVQNQYGAELPLLAKNIILAADTDHRLHRQNVIKIMDQIKVMKPITKTQQITCIYIYITHRYKDRCETIWTRRLEHT